MSALDDPPTKRVHQAGCVPRVTCTSCRWPPRSTERRSASPGASSVTRRASAAAPRTDRTLLLATEAGLGLFDPRTGEFELRHPMELGTGFRSNDGALLGDGCFWWSSMDDDGGKRPGAIQLQAHAQGDRMMIRIIDRGPGIDPAIRDRLFTPFETAKSGGLGLGLAIARDIAREFDGDLWLDPGEGQGTTFVVSLRIAR